VETDTNDLSEKYPKFEIPPVSIFKVNRGAVLNVLPSNLEECPMVANNDFYFQPSQTLDLGTPKQRFETNKQAIQLAKELVSTGCTAIPEELELLSKYVGWGDSRLASRMHEYPFLKSLEQCHAESDAVKSWGSITSFLLL
jgi:hypothetical protein